ncbi:hypothetical protein OFN60_33035, partial [Escherichia coli]|nr:hypothetical protein [Escherichia coli]
LFLNENSAAVTILTSKQYAMPSNSLFEEINNFINSKMDDLTFRQNFKKDLQHFLNMYNMDYIEIPNKADNSYYWSARNEVHTLLIKNKMM